MLFRRTNSIKETFIDKNKNVLKDPKKIPFVRVTYISKHYQRANVQVTRQLSNTLVQALTGYHWRFWALADSASGEKRLVRGFWQRRTAAWFVGWLITKEEEKSPSFTIFFYIRIVNLLKAGYSLKYIYLFYVSASWIRRYSLSWMYSTVYTLCHLCTLTSVTMNNC